MLSLISHFAFRSNLGFGNIIFFKGISFLSQHKIFWFHYFFTYLDILYYSKLCILVHNLLIHVYVIFTTPRGSSVGPALGLLPNGHQFEPLKTTGRFTRSLISGPCRISWGARKLARTPTVIKQKKIYIYIYVIFTRSTHFLKFTQTNLNLHVTKFSCNCKSKL